MKVGTVDVELRVHRRIVDEYWTYLWLMTLSGLVVGSLLARWL